MVRLALTFSILFLLAACGGSDTEGGADAGSVPPVAAASGGATDPEKQICLDLVRQAEFEQALEVCLAALQNSPADAELTAALDKAKAETVKLAAAEAAARAAATAAADSAEADAASKLGDAGKDLGQ
jgi:hypothetical protein